MSSGCGFEYLHGGAHPNCNGVCKRGSEVCEWYFEDQVAITVREWRREAGVNSPVLMKYDSKQKKFFIYTTKPGYFIGLDGVLFDRFNEKLKPLLRECLWPRKGNVSIELIKCDDYID